MHPIPSTRTQPTRKEVLLTPDDILTLKLLRDDFGRTQFAHITDPLRGLDGYCEKEKLLETLEHILKQVG
jgi:hypothetical protein